MAVPCNQGILSNQFLMWVIFDAVFAWADGPWLHPVLPFETDRIQRFVMEE